MNSLEKLIIKNWNKEHPELYLVYESRYYYKEGKDRLLSILRVRRIDNKELVTEIQGESFIDCYNQL